MRPECTRGYATPAVYRAENGPAELIVPGSFELASYAAETGQKPWWVSGLAWQPKTVPIVDHDRIIANGWEIGGGGKAVAFAEILAVYDKDHDGKLSRSEMAGSRSAEWFADNDLNHDGYIDEREWGSIKRSTPRITV